MAEGSKIRVAIIGCGEMGESVISHLRCSPHVRSITSYDPNPERRAHVQQALGIEAAESLEALLADPELRLVFITASNDVHAELTIAALEAGKAVMCEKPMATTLADAEKMVAAAERTGGFLQIGFELRYSKLYTQVKDWIEAGMLGRIVNTHCIYATGAWGRDRTWRASQDASGGMFGEKLSHYVDLVRWWLQEDVEEVYSLCAPNIIPYYQVHDNFHCSYRFKSGAVSHLTFLMGPAATFRGDPLQNAVSQQAGDGHALRYMVYGDKGAAETDVFPRTLKRWQIGEDDWGHTSEWVDTLSWDAKEDFTYFHNTHEQTLDIVRRVVAGEPPKTNARDALESMRLCFAAELSADERRPVRLEELRSPGR